MKRELVYDMARQQPFQPFRVILSSGTTYDVRHPDLIMIGERSAIIGIPKDPAGTAYYRSITVDLAHVVGIEELPAAPSSSNGPSA